MEIEVPDTQLEGEVVDAAGRPVPEAEVSVISRRLPGNRDREDPNRRLPPPMSEITADDQGRFEAWGLPPGKMLVAAEKGVLSSDIVPVNLEEGRVGEPDSPRAT